MEKKRVCVVSGSRAEYGIFKAVLEEIRNTEDLELLIAVTGMHLSPEFGLTVRQVEADGVRVDERVEMLLSSDTPVGITKSVGLGVIGFADAFARLRPDLVVLLGDRFEILAAAQAALFARIPVAHLHGGELTEGAVDESIRHAITKMSHLHFVSAEPYRQRVIRMGEAPERVFTVGAPGLDALQRMKFLSREELSDSLNWPLDHPYLLVTYHPATLAEKNPADSLRELFAALDCFPNFRALFTLSNADAAGRELREMVQRYAEANPERARAETSLGQIRYLSAMRYAAAVVGNSSSGIIEAPSFGVPTVNLGDRQKGRIRASSVLDCEEHRDAIVQAIQTTCSETFREMAKQTVNPYGDGMASARIVKILRETKLATLCRKPFFDGVTGEKEEGACGEKR